MLASFSDNQKFDRVKALMSKWSIYTEYRHNAININFFFPSENLVTLSRQCCRVPSSAVIQHNESLWGPFVPVSTINFCYYYQYRCVTIYLFYIFLYSNILFAFSPGRADHIFLCNVHVLSAFENQLIDWLWRGLKACYIYLSAGFCLCSTDLIVCEL